MHLVTRVRFFSRGVLTIEERVKYPWSKIMKIEIERNLVANTRATYQLNINNNFHSKHAKLIFEV